jgi:hypothetical protein
VVTAYQKLIPLLGRLVQHPAAQSALLVAVALVGLLMDSSLGDLNKDISGLSTSVAALDERVADQTEVVTQLKIDLQVLQATGQADSARMGERIGAIEQRVREMESRQRERDAVFDHAFDEYKRSMSEWRLEAPSRRSPAGSH